MRPNFADVIESNRAYAAGFRLGGLAAPAAKGLGVLTCIDSRIVPLAMLGLEPGDAKILRNAGARVTDDVLRSLVLATNLLEVTRIMVIVHTDCAMAGISDGELRSLLARRHGRANVDGVDFLTTMDQRASLAADVERIRGCALIPREVDIDGFVYDVGTGLLELVEPGRGA